MKPTLFALLVLLAGCGTVTTTRRVCPRVTPRVVTVYRERPKPKPVVVVSPAKIVRLMHSYCASLGYSYADSIGEIGSGDPDNRFACEDGNGTWYWFDWNDVKP